MTPDIKKNQPQKQPNTEANNNTEASKQNTIAAHDQAEKDIEQDADLSIHSPNDDLDEGETARLGEDINNLI